MSRGPHPEDPVLFHLDELPTLKRAGEEVSWLLGRGYSYQTAVSAAGNHHQLKQRQRIALSRSCASDDARASRLARRQPMAQAKGHALHVDGFNLVIALEVALAGGVLLSGREGALRDLAGLWGTYRLTEHTHVALSAVGEVFVRHAPTHVRCYLDERVSNSGRLRAAIQDAWEHQGFAIEVLLVPDPDPILSELDWVVSADRVILDRCGPWVNLAREVVETSMPQAWVVDWW